MNEQLPPDPFVVLKAEGGDVTVLGACVPRVAPRTISRIGESVRGGVRAVVEVIPKERLVASPSREWSLWIAWGHHARIVHLDSSNVCLRCGRLILDVGVTADGFVLVEH